VRQEFSGVLGEIKKDHAGLAELLTSVSEHRRFAHVVDVLAVVGCALNASFEEIDVHRLPVRADDAEHQGRAVAVTRLGEAIKLIFGHVLRSLIVHGGKRYDANSFSSAFASFRSSVSKPSVNHPYTGANSSRASCTLPWSRQRRARLIAARSSQDLAC